METLLGPDRVGDVRIERKEKKGHFRGDETKAGRKGVTDGEVEGILQEQVVRREATSAWRNQAL